MVKDACSITGTLKGTLKGDHIEEGAGKKRIVAELSLDDVTKRLGEAAKSKDNVETNGSTVIELNKDHCNKII